MSKIITAIRHLKRPATPIMSLIFVTFITCANACGIKWEQPKLAYRFADSYGTFQYWQFIGEISGSNSKKIPISIQFKPLQYDSNSLLGDGWRIPLLESKIKQIDETSYKAELPDGQIAILKTKPDTPRK